MDANLLFKINHIQKPLQNFFSLPVTSQFASDCYSTSNPEGGSNIQLPSQRILIYGFIYGLVEMSFYFQYRRYCKIKRLSSYLSIVYKKNVLHTESKAWLLALLLILNTSVPYPFHNNALILNKQRLYTKDFTTTGIQMV